MSEYGICVTCKKDYTVQGSDECMPCYFAPFGTAWEQEMIAAREEGMWW